jgi:hypothetical protein
LEYEAVADHRAGSVQQVEQTAWEMLEYLAVASQQTAAAQVHWVAVGLLLGLNAVYPVPVEEAKMYA